MSSSFLPADIRGLPVDQRLVLVEELWNSIVEDQSSLELTAKQKSELERRLLARAARPSQSLAWDEVKNRLLGE